MATTTTRLGLRKPATTDLVTVGTDLDGNYDLIDLAVGDTICTTSTRPSTPWSGQTIYETDTGKEAIWNAAWKYASSALVCTSGTRPSSTLLIKGNTIYESDTNNSLVWLGAAWQHMGSPILSTAGNFQSPYVGATYSNSTDGWVYACTNVVGPVWQRQRAWQGNLGYAEYTIATAVTDQTVGTGAGIQFNGTVAFSTPLVVASATNSIFTTSELGTFGVTVQARIASTGSGFLQVVNASTGKVYAASGPNVAAATNDIVIAFTRRLPASTPLQFNAIGAVGATIPHGGGSGSVNERTWVSFQYEGP